MQPKNLRVLVLTLLLSGVLFLFVSCGDKSNDKGLKLDLQILPDTLTDFLYVKMTYNFQCTDKFEGLNDDYRMFVHFWRKKNKEMLIQDDHMPEKTFSLWKAGDKISYSRILFIPKFLEEFDMDFEGYEEIKITVGAHNPKEKDERVILFEKLVNIQPETSNAPEMIYDEGWHQQEEDRRIKNKDEMKWRWTKKRAVCMIENPKKDCLLIIRGGIDKAKLTDQKVIFKINDKVLEEFLPEKSKFDKEFVIKKEMMGTADDFKLIIETDKTFIPSQLDPSVKDDRELGVQVYFLYFRENIK